MAKGTVKLMHEDTTSRMKASPRFFLCGITRENSRDRSGNVVGAGEAPSFDLGADLESCA